VNARPRNPLLSFFWAVGFCLVTTGSLLASSGSFQALGYVRDQDGNPVVGIDVIGDDYVGDFFIFKTDDTGHYSVDFDSDGNYKVYVSCPQLNARGFACVNPVPISITDGAVTVDFNVVPTPLQVTNTSLPKGTVGAPYTAQLGAIGGLAPYHWQLAADSPALPDGLSLTSVGLISGTPTTNLGASIKVELTDANFAVTNKTLSLVINPRPFLSAIAWTTNRFSMLLTGASNQNYTIQASTNLNVSAWTSVLITNNRTANSFIVADPKATNVQRVYRVLVGP
jgi:hypothetical protein